MAQGVPEVGVADVDVDTEADVASIDEVAVRRERQGGRIFRSGAKGCFLH